MVDFEIAFILHLKDIGSVCGLNTTRTNRSIQLVKSNIASRPRKFLVYSMVDVHWIIYKILLYYTMCVSDGLEMAGHDINYVLCRNDDYAFARWGKGGSWK